MTIQDQLTRIVADYPVYNAMEAFGEGFVAYQFCKYQNPYGDDSTQAQAWDRGLEAGMRYCRLLGAEKKIVRGQEIDRAALPLEAGHTSDREFCTKNGANSNMSNEETAETEGMRPR